MADKIKVAVSWAAACGGCDVSLLDLEEKVLDLADFADFVFWPVAIGFVVLELLRNFWRPITITRLDNETEAGMGATMLSIDSQTTAAGTMVLAPAVGLAVDRLAVAPDQPALWVVGVVGVVVTLLGAVVPRMSPAPAELGQADRDAE